MVLMIIIVEKILVIAPPLMSALCGLMLNLRADTATSLLAKRTSYKWIFLFLL